MSFPPTHHEHFAHMLERFDHVRTWLENALQSVYENEMRELSKRFPNRRIELDSGMGVTQINIKKRHSDKTTPHDDWHYAGDENSNWPDWLEIPAPELWSAIEIYQDEVSDGRDPGVGTIVYENGKRIKGLPVWGEA